MLLLGKRTQTTHANHSFFHGISNCARPHDASCADNDKPSIVRQISFPLQSNEELRIKTWRGANHPKLDERLPQKRCSSQRHAHVSQRVVQHHRHFPSSRQERRNHRHTRSHKHTQKVYKVDPTNLPSHHVSPPTVPTATMTPNTNLQR
jgi:hypothetical protein